MTPRGVPRAVRDAVLERDEYRCQRCARHLFGVEYSLQHRLPRGRGGTSLDPHTMHNLVALCGSATTLCHHLVESYRSCATVAGWLVERGQDPATQPVFRFGRAWSWLDETWRPCTPDEVRVAPHRRTGRAFPCVCPPGLQEAA